MRHALEAESRRELEHYERLLQAQTQQQKSERAREHQQKSEKAQVETQEGSSQQLQLLHRFATLREAEEFEAQQKLKQRIEQLQGVRCEYMFGCGILMHYMYCTLYSNY